MVWSFSNGRYHWSYCLYINCPLLWDFVDSRCTVKSFHIWTNLLMCFVFLNAKLMFYFPHSSMYFSFIILVAWSFNFVNWFASSDAKHFSVYIYFSIKNTHFPLSCFITIIFSLRLRLLIIFRYFWGTLIELYFSRV